MDYSIEWERYPLKAACCILMNQDGNILSVSRKTNHLDKGLPGGKCDGNETYMEAAIREVFEETGYIVADLEPVFMADGDTGEAISSLDNPPVNSKNKIPCNAVTFVAKSYNKVSEATETGRVDWVKPSDICTGSFAKYNTALLQKMSTKNVIIKSVI
jgi:8-oxo-dGTP pyrophosphatase MutT (NUDIX family)